MTTDADRESMEHHYAYDAAVLSGDSRKTVVDTALKVSVTDSINLVTVTDVANTATYQRRQVT